jgi:hypothetical protein
MVIVFLIALVGSLGGLAVLRGLWLEKSGEKEWCADLEDFRLSKSRARRGGEWIFWGVFAETVLAILITVWEGAVSIKTEAKLSGVETNIAQTSSNVTQIDPLKHRIGEISAIMRYKGVFFPDVRRGNGTNDKTLNASLHFFDLGNGEKGQFIATTNGNGIALPVLDLVAKASKRVGDEFVIEFGMDRLDFELKGSRGSREVLGLTPNSSLENFLNKINGFRAELWSPDVNVDGIEEGTVTLFEGNFEKTFTFPPQKVLVEAVGGAWPIRKYDRLPTNNLPILQVPAK